MQRRALVTSAFLAGAMAHYLGACSLDSNGISESTGSGGGPGTGGQGGATPACDDGDLNGVETDVDCGGGACDPCSFGKVCAADGDCLVRCEAGKCVAEPSMIWALRETGASPGLLQQARAAFDEERRQTVLFGGYNASLSSDTGQTWTWDGRTWVAPVTPGAPGPRQAHAMAYDSERKMVVLYGGVYAAYLGDTWEWDGAVWTASVAPTGPSPRGYSAMAFDRERKVTVLFGGTNTSGDFDETWEYDGATWALRAPTSSPPKRDSHEMVYDERRKVTVLFGGGTQFGQGATYGDTWEWDGTDWREIVVDSKPAPRVAMSMAFDPVRNETLLFGGRDNSGLYGDTWIYDGVRWVEQSVQGPVAGFVNPMVYDRARKRAVLYLGFSFFTYPAETWESWSVGLLCGAATDCGSNHCVDGLCCERPSCGACQACDTPERPGGCGPIYERDDPDTCTGAFTCDASSECVPKT